MAQAKWIWHGSAGHFICSDQCRRHLCTDVGDYRISSVGDLYIDGKRETVGATGYYETLIFRLDNKICGCGCGQRTITEWTELDGLRSDDLAEAERTHMDFCHKYDKPRAALKQAQE